MAERYPSRNSLPLRRASTGLAAIGLSLLTGCDTAPSFKTTFNFAAICPQDFATVDASLFLQTESIAASARLDVTCTDASNRRAEPLSVTRLASSEVWSTASRHIISLTAITSQHTDIKTSVHPYEYNVEVIPRPTSEFNIEQGTVNGAPISHIYNPGKFGDQP